VGVDVDVNLIEQEEEVGGEMHLRREEWSEWSGSSDVRTEG